MTLQVAADLRRIGDSAAEQLLKRYRIPLVRQLLAKSEKQAVARARALGFPVVMKLSSPDISHKTEAGGVVLGVQDALQVVAGYKKILSNARSFKRGARVSGVLIQEQASGREVIVGSKIDPSFGPVLMFGLGGIFVEVLKDVSFRLIPIQRTDAREMIREIRGFPLLAGARGEKPVNFSALEDLLLKVSRMVQREKIRELDINPLFVDHQRAVAADIRIFR